jgi:hypothetical protein
MKMIAEYLVRAAAFEQLAADERDPALKSRFLQHARACRQLAAERLRRLQVPLPQTDQPARHLSDRRTQRL